MELCSSVTTRNLLQFHPSFLSPLTKSISICSSLFNHSTRTKFVTSHKLLIFQRHVYLTQLHQLGISSPLASTASSTTNDTVPDKLPASIEVTEILEPNSRVRLRVEVPAPVCEDCYKRVIDEFMKQAKVPGFRPGKKVPESILIGYVGKQSVRKATIESILKRTLPHAMSSVSRRALKDSMRIATKFSDMEQTYSSLNSLSYDIIVDVAPEVKWVPDEGYKNLKILVEIDSAVDAHIAAEKEIRRRHKSLGAMRIVTNRGLQIGDVVVLDISATTIDPDESNVQKIPSAETKGFNFDTEDGDKVLPGFLDSIIGIKVGETKSFPLVFPDSWRQEHLRGVHAQFTVSPALSL